jgi:UDP-glucose 4-epimerase
MNVLVTGAAGFIGSHVVERLLAREHVVRGIDDLSTGQRSNLGACDVELVEGSILDADALAAAVDGVDAIVHLAARPSVPRSIVDPVATHEANTVGTVRVLEAARLLDDAHVIVASSSSVYGANPTLPKREDIATLPLSPYAVSKLATEQYTLAWQHSYGLDALALRFFNVFGPRQLPGHAYAAVVPAFVDAALRTQPLVVHGDGTQTRDFTFVGTVASVVTDALERRITCNTPVNLAFGTQVSLNELIERIASLVGHDVTREHVAARPGDVPHSQADTTRLRTLFPDTEPVSLDEGLAATIAWMGEAGAGTWDDRTDTSPAAS